MAQQPEAKLGLSLDEIIAQNRQSLQKNKPDKERGKVKTPRGIAVGARKGLKVNNRQAPKQLLTSAVAGLRQAAAAPPATSKPRGRGIRLAVKSGGVAKKQLARPTANNQPGTLLVPRSQVGTQALLTTPPSLILHHSTTKTCPCDRHPQLNQQASFFTRSTQIKKSRGGGAGRPGMTALACGLLPSTRKSRAGERAGQHAPGHQRTHHGSMTCTREAGPLPGSSSRSSLTGAVGAGCE